MWTVLTVIGGGIGELLLPVVVAVEAAVTPTVGLIGAPVEAVVAEPGALGAVVPAALVDDVLDALAVVVPAVLVVAVVPAALLRVVLVDLVLIIKNISKALSNNIIVT